MTLTSLKNNVALLSMAALLTACGGGGGSSTPAVVVPTITDTLTTVLAGDDSGRWDLSGGAGGDAGASGAGAAGDGELVGFDVDFKKKFFTWKVLRSQYGIEGQTGSFQLADDATTGGYKTTVVAGASAGTPPNLFVSKTGQVTGSIPLTINGTTRLAVYNALRYKDSLMTLAQVAGTYGYAGMARDAGTGLNPNITRGTFKISPDGQVRICSDSGYSDSCTNGNIATADFVTYQGQTMLRLTSTDSRNILAYGLVRKTPAPDNRLVITMDTSNTDPLVPTKQYTSIIYASQILPVSVTSPFAYTGSWSYVATAIDGTSITGKASFFSDGTLKHVDDGFACGDANHYGTAAIRTSASLPITPVLDGGFYLYSATEEASQIARFGFYDPSLMFPAGPDVLVLFETAKFPDAAFVVLRRHSTTPGTGGACP